MIDINTRNPNNQTKKIILILLLVLGYNYAKAQPDSTLKKFQGIYHSDGNEKILLNPREGFPHFVIMETGETRMLRSITSTKYEFSHTRNDFNSVGGSLELVEKPETAIKIVFNSGRTKHFNKISYPSEELTLNLKDSLVISGIYMRHSTLSKNKIAVLLHGDGDNDRYDLYDIGMYLVDNGYSIFAYDKRNVGNSYGPEVQGGYVEMSETYSEDASQIVEWLQQKYPTQEVGVIGISQGGWIGAMVASEVADLGFYINIAGNMSVGWQQWQHYMLSYLKRKGFTAVDIAEAEDYFSDFFNVGLEKLDFSTYSDRLKLYKDKAWFKKLQTRKLIKWNSQENAIKIVANNSFEPSEEVKKVTCPTLGVFYEFDHSTPPDSPYLFLKSLANSNAKDISIRVFSNTTHGGWVVYSYYFDSSNITRQESKAYYYIVEWLNSI